MTIDTTTLTQIFVHLNTLNAEVALCRNTYRYSDAEERWACSICLEGNNSELKIRANAADGNTALQIAYAKLVPLLSASQVVSTFDIPMLAPPATVIESEA